MQLFEMQGLLAGKCLPGDMLVGESLAQYFLRQFNQRDELARQVSALQLSQDNIINALGIKGEGAHSKLVIEYVHGLVSESEAMKSVINECQAYFIAGIRNTIRPSNEGYLHMRCDTVNDEAPNTDTFTAELRAQGVEQAADELYGSGYVYDTLKCYVANLRAGREG